jgi:paraquat-inducible protein B
MKANPKAIGAFVVGGIVLLILGLVTFGSFTFFEKRLPIVMFFEGDLSGLDVGAPVVFRGVRIGTVTGVTLHFNSKTRDVQIPVSAEIEPDRFVVEGEFGGGTNIPRLIQDGLRAQLATQSILTGKLLVLVDMFPGTPVRLVGAGGKVAEIPTVPSALAELKSSVDAVLNKVEAMPLAELIGDLRTLALTATAAIQKVDTSKLGAVTDAAVDTLHDVRAMIVNLNKRVDTLTPLTESTLKNTDQAVVEARRTLLEVRPLIASLQRTAESAERLMLTANAVIEPGSPVYRDLVTLLREFANTARSVRALADDLERNPDSIVFGKASAGRAR